MTKILLNENIKVRFSDAANRIEFYLNQSRAISGIYNGENNKHIIMH